MFEKNYFWSHRVKWNLRGIYLSRISKIFHWSAIIKSRENKLPPTKIQQKFTPFLQWWTSMKLVANSVTKTTTWIPFLLFSNILYMNSAKSCSHEYSPKSKFVIFSRETWKSKIREIKGGETWLQICCYGNLKTCFFLFLKSSGHQSLPCLFDSCFLQKFRTTPIFGMSRDHNRKRLKTRTERIVFEI